MYNVDKLEQEWKRYRFKRLIIPSVVGLVAISIVGVSVYFFTNNKLHDNRNVVVKKSIEKDRKITKESPEKNSTVEKMATLATAVPSLGSVQSDKRPKMGQIIFQDPNAEPPIRRKRKNSLHIEVTERGGKNIVSDIEDRFEFAKDKSDSLFLAKYYYDKMEYAKAEKWALETNKLDNKIEESWLIFAKAQAKQGKRVDAIKILKAFIDQDGSSKARVLIDKIRRGKNF